MPFSFLHIIIVFLFPFILYVAAGLRSRSAENKAVIVSEVENIVWPAIEAGRVKPVIYKYFPLSDVAEAHRVMESSGHIGKILLFP
jgi:NADPH:quinone reductase-like Zn-dependent oxidoreductase